MNNSHFYMSRGKTALSIALPSLHLIHDTDLFKLLSQKESFVGDKRHIFSQFIPEFIFNLMKNLVP